MQITISLIIVTFLVTNFSCNSNDPKVTDNSNDPKVTDNGVTQYADGGSSCAPSMDSRGEGSCENIIDYIWDGEKCDYISGCRCVGEDCSKLFKSKLLCQVENALCLGLSLCGGPDSLTCTSDEYCEGGGGVYSNESISTGCGKQGSLGICRQRPKKCPEEGDTSTPTPNCGCDVNYYESYCETHLAGTEVAYAANDENCE